MKHFFFPVKNVQNNAGLLERLLSEWGTTAQTDNEKRLEILYDMIDVIYDKRFGKDDELTMFHSLLGGAKSNQNEKTSENNQKKDALKVIEAYVAENISRKGLSEKGILKYHLVQGNLAIRFSQLYDSSDESEQTERYSTFANRTIWQGLNQAEQYLTDDDENNLDLRSLKLFLKLNLANYYFIYARRNRRSNFTSAEGILQELKKEIEEEVFPSLSSYKR